jgi:alpha-mannosidase
MAAQIKTQKDNSQPGTIHFIGNAHIDPVWLWRWPEGYQETRATFRSALDRMKEFPDFIFTASQAAVYRWIEESDPIMFEEIRQRVNEGRWAIVNGWWMEPDCLTPCGESFARQSLYGQRFFLKKFGKTCLSGYCVDSFGHNGMLPQLLLQGGFKYYVFMRPNRIENPSCPEGPFWWESPDGSRVLAYRLLSAYGTGPEGMTPEAVMNIAAYFTPAVQDEMFFYGVGDHGGGPTIKNIQSIQAMQQDPSLPNLTFSSPDHFFESLLCHSPEAGANLPVYRGDLQYHAAGCYAAHSGVKRWNRKAEHDLMHAERWSTISHVIAATPYPGQEFATAWELVLFNQFHDILAGSSIREAYDDARDAFGSVFQTAESHLNRALQRISSRVDTTGGDSAVVVYNPHSFAIKAPIECELMTWNLGGRPLHLVDQSNREVTWQPGPLSATVPQGWRMRLCFLADLPPMGYKVFHLNRSSEETAQTTGPAVEKLPLTVVNGYEVESDGRPNLAVDNEFIHLELDTHLGVIAHLVDKRTGNEVFSGHAAKGVVIDDPSDTWSHGVTAFRIECGRFGDARLKCVEMGSERVVIRSKSFYGKSILTQDFIIYQGLPWIEVRVVVEWHEQLKLLKLAFPVNVQRPIATYEIPYGTIERPTNGLEVPGQRWFDVTGETPQGLFGLSILNNAKYSFDVLGAEMRMTVLRSPVYAHHTPHKLEADQDYVYMDQGPQEFSYILLPHAGPWQAAETVQLAEVLNMPPVALPEGIHSGELPPEGNFISVMDPHVQIGVLKIAEEGQDIIVRCRETSGGNANTVLKIPFLGREIDLRLTPWQVKTLRIPRDIDLPVHETNFLES